MKNVHGEIKIKIFVLFPFLHPISLMYREMSNSNTSPRGSRTRHSSNASVFGLLDRWNQSACFGTCELPKKNSFDSYFSYGSYFFRIFVFKIFKAARLTYQQMSPTSGNPLQWVHPSNLDLVSTDGMKLPCEQWHICVIWGCCLSVIPLNILYFAPPVPSCVL